ncbi:hypothetical protein ACFL3J_03135 [Candidatus Omnitrophota bacterium]
MHIRSKKGFALGLAIIFSIVLIILSLGMFTAVRYSVRGVAKLEKGKIEGHYLGIAGLRYAAILLRDPSSLSFPYTVTGDELGGTNFFTNIGADPADMDIIIGEITTGPDAGKYDVSATYRY